MSTQTTNKNFIVVGGPLLLVLFIDGMGLSLVFPILNSLIMDPNNTFLPAATSAEARNLIFGSVISLSMVCWFFGSALLGDISDQIGRKKSLLICLAGAAAGYLASALAVITDSLTLIIIGRAIAGFTAGSQPIAQAAIVDISTQEMKARNIALILLSVSLGFIVGPIFGGVLSDNRLVSWFNFSTPFYFATIVSLINIVLLWYLFQETFEQKQKLSVKWHHAVGIFISAFKNEKVRNLSITLLIMILGWSCFYSFIPMFLLRRFEFSSLEVSMYMAAMGVGFGIGTVIVHSFTRRFTLKNIVITGLAIAAFLALLLIFATQAIYTWILILPLTAAVSVAYSVLLTIFSNQVDANSQGWVMGITGSIMAFAFGVSGFAAGALACFGVAAPLILTILGLSLSSLMLYRLKVNTSSQTT